MLPVHKAKNRPLDKKGGAINGGGTAIIFDPRRISLKEYKLKKSTQEIVAAYGKLPNIKRKIFIISAYIPPKARAGSYAAAAKLIRDAILNVKKTSDNPYVLLGGDFNRHKFKSITDAVADLEIHELGSTCGKADLDKLASCLLYTSPSPRDRQKSRMPSSA